MTAFLCHIEGYFLPPDTKLRRRAADYLFGAPKKAHMVHKHSQGPELWASPV